MLWHKYPSLKYLISAILGILYYNWYPHLPILGVFIVTFFIFIGSFFLKNYGIRLGLILGTVGLFYSISYIQYEQLKATHYSHHMAGSTSYTARIIGMPERKPNSYKALAEVLSLKKNDKWRPASGKILLYFNHEAQTSPVYGQVYLLKNKVREIEPPKNPFEFNYKAYQQRRNISSHQFLRKGDFKLLFLKEPNPLYGLAIKANAYSHSVFQKTLTNTQHLSVADALISGQQSGLDFETKQAYSTTGTIHALAVSGTHVAILFTFLSILFSKILKLKPLPCFVAISLVLSLYAVYTGLSASVCRATFMFILIQLAVTLKRESDTLHILFLSAFVLLMVNTAWLYDVGFQLSYLAVMGIVVLHPLLNRLNPFGFKAVTWLWEISTVSLAATVFTLPLSLYYFHQFPNYFLVLNPLVAVLSSAALPLGLLLVALFKIKFVGLLLGKLFGYTLLGMHRSVETVAAWPGVLTKSIVLHAIEVGLLFIIIYYAVAFLKNKQPRAILISLSVLVVFLTGRTIKTLGHASQHEISFHFIPKAWGVSILKGQTATFFASDSLSTDPMIYQFHLKNYYDAKGIKDLRTIAVNQTQLLTIGDTHILLQNKPVKGMGNFDYILSGNKTYSESLKTKKLLLDGTYTKYQSEKLRAHSVNAVSLYDKGSQTFSLAHKQ